MRAGLSPSQHRALAKARAGKRKGVAAVLAMMFLIMFGSLSAAMAIASRGNIKTAATHLHVNRARNAAESGLEIAGRRLHEGAQRFLVSDSNVSQTFGWNMWRGAMSGMATYDIVPPEFGRQDLADPGSLAQAVRELHAVDQNTVGGFGVTTPTIANAPTTRPSDTRATSWLFTPMTVTEYDAEGNPALGYTVTYAPVSTGTTFRVRAIVTGYDFAYTRNGMPVTRTVSTDFELRKRLPHAIIAPSRVMLGRNVQVTGDLGLRYDDVGFNNGDPLIARSDFRGLDATLDSVLTPFYAKVATNDVDGDNRLRVGHAIEGAGIEEVNDLEPDPENKPLVDVTGDGFVDEFDLFINRFDTNNDNRVSRAEFSDGSGTLIDSGLFELIDSSYPDRNRNGLWGFIDTNSDGRKQATEVFVDIDPDTAAASDQVLGYMDGFLDYRDRYVKIRGTMSFKVAQDDWANARGATAGKLQGGVRTRDGGAAQVFEVDDTDLPLIDASSFAATRNDMVLAANGGTFAAQTASPTGVPGGPAPVVQALTADANLDGLPDNHATAYFEKMPFNSPSFSDWYYRPVYKNIVFRDVQIPVGTNAYFENCWFIGVTWVRSHTNNDNVLWSEYGKLRQPSLGARPVPAVPRDVYGDDAGETSYPTMLPSSATPPNQMILMANPPLDKADIPANEVGFTTGFDNLPDPLIVAGKRITDTKALSNNIRFHNCLFVGSIVTDTPVTYSQARNKLQFTGSTRFAQQNPLDASASYNPDVADALVIASSSMMAPNYSVDIGTFNSPQTQNVALRGAVIAGVLDVRGNATIDGALLLTFEPRLGEGPMQDALGNPMGNPANYNSTLGYFGPDDGDSEAINPETLPVNGAGQRIVGWDTNGDGFEDVPGTAPQPPGSTAVLFNGFGAIRLRFDPDMRLPQGLMLPLQFDRVASTYAEGS